MITVFADGLSTEYNITLINKNMTGELLMIGFSVQASCFYLKIKDNRLIFWTSGYFISMKYYTVAR